MNYITTFDVTFYTLAVLQIMTLLASFGIWLYANKYNKVEALTLWSLKHSLRVNMFWPLMCVMSAFISLEGTTTFVAIVSAIAIPCGVVRYLINQFETKRMVKDLNDKFVQDILAHDFQQPHPIRPPEDMSFFKK